MRAVFADAAYWVALANPLDQWHARAKHVSLGLGPHRIFTTDEVLTEFLNFFSERGETLRASAVAQVAKVFSNPNVVVLPQSRDSFSAGRELYENRPDKGYSLTDCISMQAMREHQLTEALTPDRHFEQEGFVALMKPPSR